jgi:hypothetical protein
MTIFGITRAKAEDPPPPVDAARQNERYAIEPGTESLFGDMLGKGEPLSGGCKLSDGQIQRTSVLATYTCGDAQVVLELLHPESAPSGGVRTERFAISVKSGAPPGGLVEAVADRIRGREAAFQWTEVGDAGARSESGARTRRRLALAGAAVVAILGLWALRRRARGRTPAE